MNEVEECNACNGYGFRFMRIWWDRWERYLWQKSVKPCRECNGKGIK